MGYRRAESSSIAMIQRDFPQWEEQISGQSRSYFPKRQNHGGFSRLLKKIFLRKIKKTKCLLPIWQVSEASLLPNVPSDKRPTCHWVEHKLKLLQVCLYKIFISLNVLFWGIHVLFWIFNMYYFEYSRWYKTCNNIQVLQSLVFVFQTRIIPENKRGFFVSLARKLLVHCTHDLAVMLCS